MATTHVNGKKAWRLIENTTRGVEWSEQKVCVGFKEVKLTATTHQTVRVPIMEVRWHGRVR